VKQAEDNKTLDMFEVNSTQPCVCCGESVPVQRAYLGYKTCPPCGEKQARQVRHTIAPMNKSNYMVFTDASMLKQLNPKRTT
jgi:predicted RNA-binding Zn-ribbon protein involved in translation (DUF1610 family)